MKHGILGPRVSDSLGLGWDPRISISNKLPGDTDTAGPVQDNIERRNVVEQMKFIFLPTQ